MNDPADSPGVMRSRLPGGGERFLARDAADAVEAFYRHDRLEGCDDDLLVVVAGKFGSGADRRFEIAFFRSFDLTAQLEVSLSYPTSLRCLFFPTISDYSCDSPADADGMFHEIRASRWFRRYAAIEPASCAIRWRGEDEMGAMFAEIVPKLMESIGPHL